MLIKDTEQQEISLTLDKREEEKEKIRKWLEDESNSAVYIDDENRDPTLIARQMGRPLSPVQLERKLTKLLPKLSFRYHPFNETKKALYFVKPDGTKEYICAYENRLMPEHSIMARHTENVRDISVEHIDRKDLPKAEWSETENKWVFNGEIPGIRKIVKPWHEAIRGWRTVLIRLVSEGYLTPDQVEREFEPDNRTEWASAMGKRAYKEVPW